MSFKVLARSPSFLTDELRQSSITRGLQRTLDTLVRGEALTPQYASRIIGMIELRKSASQYILDRYRVIGRTADNLVTVKYSPLGRVHHIRMSPIVAKMPYVERKEFIISAVGDAAFKARRLIWEMNKQTYDDCLDFIYDALEGGNHWTLPLYIQMDEPFRTITETQSEEQKRNRAIEVIRLMHKKVWKLVHTQGFTMQQAYEKLREQVTNYPTASDHIRIAEFGFLLSLRTLIREGKEILSPEPTAQSITPNIDPDIKDTLWEIPFTAGDAKQRISTADWTAAIASAAAAAANRNIDPMSNFTVHPSMSTFTSSFASTFATGPATTTTMTPESSSPPSSSSSSSTTQDTTTANPME